MLIRYTTNAFPLQYLPTVFDNYSANVIFDGHAINLGLWDTAGAEDYERLRPLSYPQTDVFLVLFDVAYPDSFHKVSSKWVPEIKLHCPDVPFILVATKADLRENKECIASLNSFNKDRVNKVQIVTTEMGTRMAKKVGAHSYVEISSLTGKGVNALFDEAMRLVISPEDLTKIPKSDSGFSLKKILKILPDKSDHARPSHGTKEARTIDINHSLYGHSGAIVGNHLYIVGGSVENKGSASFYRFLFREQKFSRTEEVADFPSAIQFTTCISYNHSLFIFGGKANGYKNDLYRYDTVSKKLYKITAANPPSPRYGHTAVFMEEGANKKMVVFGGYDSDGMTCNDLYTFDLDKLEWNKIIPETGSPVPLSRYMHSSVIIQKVLYIFGGSGDKGALNDLHKFNFGTGMWAQITPSSPKQPLARFGHTAVLREHHMYVHGGAYKTAKHETKILDDFWSIDLWATNNYEWHEEKVNNMKSPRYNHLSVYDPLSSSFLNIGGKDKEMTLANISIIANSDNTLLERLPRVILDRIMRTLSMEELVENEVVSKKWKEISTGDEVWRTVVGYIPLKFWDNVCKAKKELTIRQRFNYYFLHMANPKLIAYSDYVGKDQKQYDIDFNMQFNGRWYFNQTS